MKTFIVQYTKVDGAIGVQVVQSKSIEGLAHRMWMLQKAKVIEVEAVDAWSWDGKDFKPSPASKRAFPRLIK